MVSRIITLIGAVIGTVGAVMLIVNINRLRGGLEADDSRTIGSAITGIVINGAMILAAGGMVAYAISQLGKISF